jgi:hypothetical protein
MGSIVRRSRRRCRQRCALPGQYSIFRETGNARFAGVSNRGRRPVESRQCGARTVIELASSPHSCEKRQASRLPFIFAIPLIARSLALDWDEACRSLVRTLRSVLNQSDPNFYVGVCCQDAPDLPPDIKHRVNLIDARFPPPNARNQEMLVDKRRKKLELARVLAEMGGGFYFALDADDLVSRDVVAYARQEADPNGYLIQSGYVMDAKSGALAPVPGEWIPTTFDQLCGSCAILNLSRADLPGGRRFAHNDGLFCNLDRHADFSADAAAIARPLNPVPFPAAVYVLNNGNNASYVLNAWRSPRSELHADIARNALPVSRDLAERFGLPSGG